MKLLFSLIVSAFAATTLAGQCELPYNMGMMHYQNGITYSGQIYKTHMPDGSITFRIDPSLLSFRKNELTGDSIAVSGSGEWFFKWNYAALPNRWQPVLTDCRATSCNLMLPDGTSITEGALEVDFYYFDFTNKISSSYKGSVKADIETGERLLNP